MMMIWIHIAKQHGNLIDTVKDDVDLAVIEQIPKSGSAGDGNDSQPGSFDGRHQLKFSVL